MDSNESYAYGWSAKGQRAHASKPGGSKTRISVIAGLHNKKLAAPCYFTGSTDAAFFNEWLEHHLLPTLPAGVTLIMDNARFHKSNRTREIIEQANCYLLFLSPYSPDYNPIEHRWFQLKNAARKILRTHICLKSAIEAAILNHS
jgi:transposase